MKKQIWHNPENVPASKVPKGWRFLRPHEVDGRFAGRCRTWMESQNDWVVVRAGSDRSWTYIVREDDGKPSPKPKSSTKQKTLWAIWSPYAKDIIPSSMSKSRKNCWSAFGVSTDSDVDRLKKEGFRAIKVPVSYEEKV